MSPNGSVELADPTHPLVIHHVPSVHASDMVIVHLPEQQLLFEADLFSPALAPVLPWVRELRDAMVVLNLTDAAIIPAHGAVTSFAVLEHAIAELEQAL